MLSEKSAGVGRGKKKKKRSLERVHPSLFPQSLMPSKIPSPPKAKVTRWRKVTESRFGRRT